MVSAAVCEPAILVARLLKQALSHGLPARMLLNVNFPFRPMSELAGVQFTRLGTRVYEDTLVRKVDPRGKEYYWIGGEDPVWRPEPGTDYHAVHAGYVSVTPMQLDLTDHAAIGAMESWSLVSMNSTQARIALGVSQMRLRSEILMLKAPSQLGRASLPPCLGRSSFPCRDLTCT